MRDKNKNHSYFGHVLVRILEFSDVLPEFIELFILDSYAVVFTNRKNRFKYVVEILRPSCFFKVPLT